MNEILSIFLKSYITSNRRFPQTRCYFVLNIASKLNANDLDLLLNNLPTISDNIIESFALSANQNHKDHRVAKTVDSKMIRADIDKMLLSLQDSFRRYCALTEVADCHAEFSQDCIRLKGAIDASSLSADYLEFVSPQNHAQTEGVALLRVRNTFLESRLFAMQMDHENILKAIEPEVVRSILVLRVPS